MHRLHTTAEVSRTTGIPVSTLRLWVSAGWLHPASPGDGRGTVHLFSEDNMAQARAIAEIKGLFGDGSAARQVIPELVPQVTRNTGSVRIRGFEVVLG
jgi:hypothetical protein